jgi:cell division septation protein DedD
MKNKDFREIQVSSSLLVVIFLGVLVLGVFIFLLGVSVGKKQVGAGTPTQIVTQQIPEPVKEPPVKPTPSETASDAANVLPGAGRSQPAASDPAAKPPAKETVVDKAPAKKTVETKRTAPATRGLYYVQVLAVADRAQAQAAAEGYRKQGYTAVIVDPPTGERNYKVRLGGYATKDRANELLKKLNAAAGKRTDYWVVQY